MRILIRDDWRDGYLDEHRPDGAVRIRTRALITVHALKDLYFVRERSLWRLWNYFREVGLLWVVRKVISRSKESSRNQKFLSAGWGTVVEAPKGSRIAVGAPVGLAVLALAYFSNLNASLTHYGTTPAPIYFGTGYVKQGNWWTIGFIVSIINIAIWSTVGVVWWKFLGWW